MTKSAQPTIEDIRTHADAIEAKFGKDTNLAYAGVSKTQLSIASYYGGAKVQGDYFVYNPADDSLIREDVVKFLVKLKTATEATEGTRAKPSKAKAAQEDFPF